MSLQLDVTHLSLNKTAIISGLHIDVPPGVVHTVMGPSGSGKSSLLAAVCGTLPAVFTFEGTVVLDGVRVDLLPTRQRRVGILFQDDLLFAHMTVREWSHRRPRSARRLPRLWRQSGQRVSRGSMGSWTPNACCDRETKRRTFPVA